MSELQARVALVLATWASPGHTLNTRPNPDPHPEDPAIQRYAWVVVARGLDRRRYKDIASDLGVSRSRVAQIFAMLIRKLRGGSLVIPEKRAALESIAPPGSYLRERLHLDYEVGG